MFSQHCASSVPKVLTDVDSLSLAKWGICTSQLKQNNTVEKCYRTSMLSILEYLNLRSVLPKADQAATNSR